MNKTLAAFGRRLRLGVIGGGPGSFIGPVHRASARLDDNFEVVASVLSSNPEKSRAAARDIGVAPDRAYGSAETMFATEAHRGDGMEVVAIMTPNDSHYALACMALDHGLDVICDKPLTTNLADALDLVRRVERSGLVFCLTFNYTGFPLVRQASAMFRDGDLGPVRMFNVEYIQSYNSTLTPGEAEDNARGWRFHPDKVGASTVLGDIGSHAFHLATFVTGQDVDRVLADVTAVVPGRKMDDTASLVMRLANGATGTLFVTQAAPGGVHGLHIRAYGTRGGIEWFEEEPNQLRHFRKDAPALILERGGPGLKPEAQRAQRTVIGHPEGYLEAFAVLYADAAEAIVARRTGAPVSQLAQDFPTVLDGAKAMKFIDAALESTRSGTWAGCALPG
jgi:predicted dehydrogenase